MEEEPGGGRLPHQGRTDGILTLHRPGDTVRPYLGF